jgi:hypothetical protein
LEFYPFAAMVKKQIYFVFFGIVLLVASSFGVRPYLNAESAKVKKQLALFYGTDAVELLALPNSDRSKALFYRVENESVAVGYVYVGRVNSCRAGGCAVDKTVADDQTSEYFDYLAILDTAMVVQQVRIIDYKATHGMEISNKGWLKQFIGHNGQADYEVGKQVDAIAGATISVYAITNDINNLHVSFRQSANAAAVQRNDVADRLKNQ